MEAGTTPAGSTGSKTIADLCTRAAEQFADGPTTSSSVPPDAISLDDLRRRGNRRDADLLRARTEAVGPDDPFTFIYTSGTTGPPKGCVLTHGNYRSVLDMAAERGLFEDGDTVY